MDFKRMMAEKREFTPKRGFNLVGVDDYEDPGEKLYLIGNYSTREQAEREAKKRKRKHRHEVTHIYPAK